MNESIIPIIDPPDLSERISFSSESTYQLRRQLGQGGMGEVWLADKVSAGGHSQPVAIKFLINSRSSQALAAEALRMSHLAHDNIVPFIDSGRDSGGRFFVAMAFVEGVDLDGLRALVGLTTDLVYSGTAKHRVPDPIAGFVMFMILRALHHAHSYNFGEGVVGLIHRDVSPGNILIDEARGFVKLTDFGVAIGQSSVTDDSEIAGKVPFIAPEVLIDRTVDARVDIYSLGLVAYELLTGFNPNVMPSQMASVIGAVTSVMLSTEKPLRPPHKVVKGIDPRLSDIVSKMVATKPAERYASAESVSADLSHCLYDHGVGPTTGSLSGYLSLLKNALLTPTPRIRRSLRFLTDKDNQLNIRPQYQLTDEARKDLEAGRNPGRIWD
jgi:eukaryotic-like serine/threonine-protein kinase